MDRITIIGVSIGFLIGFVPFIDKGYSIMNRQPLIIPQEFQNELIANQHIINDCKEVIDKTYKKNQKLVEKLLELNNIKRAPGEKYFLTLKNGAWGLTKK